MYWCLEFRKYSKSNYFLCICLNTCIGIVQLTLTCAVTRNRMRMLMRRVSSHVADFNARNKSLTAKLLQQGYRYNKLRKTFSKFHRRNYELVSKFNAGLKTLLHQGLSEPEFSGDLVYKLKNVGSADFSDQFRKNYHMLQKYWI